MRGLLARRRTRWTGSVVRSMSRLAVGAAVLGLAALLVGCDADGSSRTASDARVDPAQVDATMPPSTGACRVLTPRDVAQPSNATRTVSCTSPHTAETFAVGTLPASLESVDYDSDALGSFAYRTCGSRFASFVGADDSLAMRTVLTWAWFRPSEKAWDRGARWYRCDVVGGGEQSRSYVDLPTTTRGLLADGQPADRWLVCVDGPSVTGAPRIPCSKPHTWRAVTAIKVGDAGDAYPGDHVVEVKTRTYCSDYIKAWLGYPDSYDYGYTWFHRAEWDAGNRRSVCWAKTQA